MQIVVDVKGRAGCGLKVIADTLDLLKGHTANVHCGPTLTVTSTNFLPYRSIRGGTNRISFKVETIKGARLDEARVLGDSGLIASQLGPANIRFRRVESNSEIVVGGWFDIPFELRNNGDRPAREVLVQLLPAKGMRYGGSRSKAVGTLGPGEEASGRFRVQPSRAGEQLVAITAASTANQPVIELKIMVAANNATGPQLLVVLGGTMLIIVGVVILYVHQRRNKQPLII